MQTTTEVFQFLHEVYGIEDVILPADAKAAVAKGPEILFISELTSLEYETQYRPLFEKIVGAMGIDNKRMALSLSDKPVPVADVTKVCVFFANQEPGWTDAYDGKPRRLFVPSLESMTAHQDLKKVTWKYLKELMESTSVEV